MKGKKKKSIDKVRMQPPPLVLSGTKLLDIRHNWNIIRRGLSIRRSEISLYLLLFILIPMEGWT